MAAIPFPVIARPLPLSALYARMRAHAAELALLAAQAADRACPLEAANLETLAEIYVEDARHFARLANEAETAPRMTVLAFPAPLSMAARGNAAAAGPVFPDRKSPPGPAAALPSARCSADQSTVGENGDAA